MFESKRILIVEDSLVLSLVEQRMVQRLGCTVVGNVDNGKEAISIFRENSPDCILIDVWLNGEIDGIEVIKKIRQEAAVPVIFITGDLELLAERCEYEKGYTEVIIKPFTAEMLTKTLKRIFQTDHMSQVS
ncbi:MAG: response regulator [Balneolaceae bacterium]|nr:response regulator [Balneolaceae bacterium]